MSDSIFTRKRKSRAWIAVPVLLLPLYLFLFPRPIGRETFLRPVWVLDLRRAAAEAGLAELPGIFPFRAGKRFGYASPDGRLLYSELSRYQVALSEKGFINYGSRPDHLVFMDPGGGFQFGIQSFGYPLLDSSGEVLYSANTDLGGLKRLSPDGEILWQGEFSSPMTSIALRRDGCLIGLLDGRAVLYGLGGETRFSIDPPGSRIPVILGTALADSGSLALVSGIDPQKLILVTGERFETVRSVELASDFRREVVLSFGPQGRFLYVEQEDAVMVLEPGRERTGVLSLPGRLKSFAAGRDFAVAAAEDGTLREAEDGTLREAEDGWLPSQAEDGTLREAEDGWLPSQAEDGRAAAHGAGANGPKARLVVFRPPAVPLAMATLSTASMWSRVSERSLFVGLDDELLRADLVEE